MCANTTFWEHIEINPKILGGKPVVRKTRIPVEILLEMIRDGASIKDIVLEYPRLSEDDVKAVLDYSLYLIKHPDEEIITLS